MPHRLHVEKKMHLGHPKAESCDHNRMSCGKGNLTTSKWLICQIGKGSISIHCKAWPLNSSLDTFKTLPLSTSTSSIQLHSLKGWSLESTMKPPDSHTCHTSWEDLPVWVATVETWQGPVGVPTVRNTHAPRRRLNQMSLGKCFICSLTIQCQGSDDPVKDLTEVREEQSRRTTTVCLETWFSTSLERHGIFSKKPACVARRAERICKT